MITFKHKKDLRNDLFNLKKSCLEQVYKYNQQKNKILESFIREIEKNQIKHCDIENEFNTRIMPKMASFGGKISGQTRLVKSEFAKYILTCLVDENKNYFQQFTTMNFIVFSQFFLTTSPTKKTILSFVDNSIDWKIKNLNNPDFSRKESFRKYLSKLEFDKSELFWVDWFNDEYSNFRNAVQRSNQISREMLILIKKSIK